MTILLWLLGGAAAICVLAAVCLLYLWILPAVLISFGFYKEEKDGIPSGLPCFSPPSPPCIKSSASGTEVRVPLDQDLPSGCIDVTTFYDRERVGIKIPEEFL